MRLAYNENWLPTHCGFLGASQSGQPPCIARVPILGLPSNGSGRDGADATAEALVVRHSPTKREAAAALMVEF